LPPTDLTQKPSQIRNVHASRCVLPQSELNMVVYSVGVTATKIWKLSLRAVPSVSYEVVFAGFDHMKF